MAILLSANVTAPDASIDIDVALDQRIRVHHINVDLEVHVIIGESDSADFTGLGVLNKFELFALVAEAAPRVKLKTAVAIALIACVRRSIVHASARICPLLVTIIAHAVIDVFADAIHLMVACGTLACILAFVIHASSSVVADQVTVVALFARGALAIIVVDTRGRAQILLPTHCRFVALVAQAVCSFRRSGFILARPVVATVHVVFLVLARIHWDADVTIGALSVSSRAHARVPAAAHSATNSVAFLVWSIGFDTLGARVALGGARCIALALVNVTALLASVLQWEAFIAPVAFARVRKRGAVVHFHARAVVNAFTMGRAYFLVFTGIHFLARLAGSVATLIARGARALELTVSLGVRARGLFVNSRARLIASFSTLVHVNTSKASAAATVFRFVAAIAPAREGRRAQILRLLVNALTIVAQRRRLCLSVLGTGVNFSA
jgi:hypothetical protein